MVTGLRRVTVALSRALSASSRICGHVAAGTAILERLSRDDASGVRERLAEFQSRHVELGSAMLRIGAQIRADAQEIRRETSSASRLRGALNGLLVVIAVVVLLVAHRDYVGLRARVTGIALDLCGGWR